MGRSGSARSWTKKCCLSRRIHLGNLDHHGYLFESAKEWCLVARTSGGVPTLVDVPSSPGMLSLTGHQGAATTVTVVPGGSNRLTLQPTDAPLYLKWGLKNNPALQAAKEALPLRLAVLPCGPQQAAVQILPSGNVAAKARVILTDVEGLAPESTSKEIQLLPDGAMVTVTFPLQAAPEPSYRYGARLEIDGQTMLTVAPSRFVAQADQAAEGLRTFVTGDEKVPGTAMLAKAAPPVPPPVGG